MKGWKGYEELGKVWKRFGKGGKEDLFTIYYEWCEKQPKSSPKGAQKELWRDWGLKKEDKKKSLRGVY